MLNAQTIARPYAKAAFEYALEHNQLENWKKMLEILVYIVKEDKVQKMLDSTNIDQEIANKIIFIAEGYLDEKVENFVRVLVENKRIFLLENILEEFDVYFNQYKQQLDVDVLSVEPLTEEQQQKIKNKLEIKFQQKIILNNIIDKSLIAGIIIKTKDVVIDGSSRGQLNRLASQLLF